jgi:Cof subfamily protein (haloacid dehalogenase superfamily)
MAERQGAHIRMVIFDVDGTILTRDNQIPESAARAIRSVRRNGKVALFFTGRPYAHIPKAVLEIGFDGCICLMGGYIRIGDEVVQDLRPSPEVAGRAVALVRECGLDAVYEAASGAYFDGARPLSPFLARLKAGFEERGIATAGDIDAAGFTFDKLCVWTNGHSDLEQFEQFEREAASFLGIAGKKRNMAEFAAKGISARESVREAMRRFGVSEQDCYAIGDSISDLPMLRCAGHSIAMGEAPEELKAQVEFVTKGILEDGLAFAMEHYGLA